METQKKIESLKKEIEDLKKTRTGEYDNYIRCIKKIESTNPFEYIKENPDNLNEKDLKNLQEDFITDLSVDYFKDNLYNLSQDELDKLIIYVIHRNSSIMYDLFPDTKDTLLDINKLFRSTITENAEYNATTIDRLIKENITLLEDVHSENFTF